MIVGAGYIGLEMAEGLTARGLAVTQIEQLPEVLPTVDPELGALVQPNSRATVSMSACDTRVDSIRQSRRTARTRDSRSAPPGPAESRFDYGADVVLVVVGVRPDTDLAASAQARTRDQRRRSTSTGRCARTSPTCSLPATASITHHRLLGTTYLPLGTTAHKQGRVAGENASRLQAESSPAASAPRSSRSSTSSPLAPALRDHEATAAGFDPLTVTTVADDHKAYYPGSQPITMAYTGDRKTGRLLGVQIIGHLGSEIAKRIDIPATAIFNGMGVDAISDLDLSYTPPLGSPWDALQAGAQAWARESRR